MSLNVIKKLKNQQAEVKCNTCGYQWVAFTASIKNCKSNPCAKCRQIKSIKDLIATAKQYNYPIYSTLEEILDTGMVVGKSHKEIKITSLRNQLYAIKSEINKRKIHQEADKGDI